jgi:hypothetical protein
MLHLPAGSWIHIPGPNSCATAGVPISSCPANRANTRRAAILSAELEAIATADERGGSKLAVEMEVFCWWRLTCDDMYS